MKMRLKTIWVCGVVILFSSQAIAECVSREISVNGVIQPSRPFDIELSQSCDEEGRCVRSSAQIAAREDGSILLLHQYCSGENGRMDCGDWNLLETFSPSSDPLAPYQPAPYELSVAENGGKETKTFVFNPANLRRGGDTAAVLHETSRRVGCIDRQRRTAIKTKPDEVRDELNPYDGDHPDALIKN